MRRKEAKETRPKRLVPNKGPKNSQFHLGRAPIQYEMVFLSPVCHRKAVCILHSA